MVGQAEAVTVLQSVAKSPERAPRSYILYGQRGLGKTSLARILARSLSCESFRDEPCLACQSCFGFSEIGMNYTEVDAARAGNVDYVRKFVESLIYTPSDGYRVVCFDEIHAASPQAQGVLLKSMEDFPANIFFLFCTTSVDKVLPELRERAVEVMFSPVQETDMQRYLIKLCERESLAYDQEILDRIMQFAQGHVRDAVMKLDLYRLVGDREKFFKIVNLPERDILEVLIALRSGSRERYAESVKALAAYPLAHLRRGFDMVILNLLRRYSGAPLQYFLGEYEMVLSLYGDEVLNFLPLFSSDWAYSCFRNDLSFNGLMWYLYSILAKKVEAMARRAGGTDGRFRKGARALDGLS